MRDRDKDYFDDEFEREQRERGYRRANPREGQISRSPERDERDRGYYQPPEGYQSPALREGYGRDYERERYLRDRDTSYDRFSGSSGRETNDRLDSRYESRTEPRRPVRSEYADRDHTAWSHTTPEVPQRSQLRCRDIMTNDVVACRRDTNIREVARVMRDEDTGVLPVVDDHDRVIGVVTDRDIVVRILGDKDIVLDAVTVADAMSDHVYSIRPTDRVVDCIRKMSDKQVRRMIVTDDNGRLKGIISMSDVATEAEYDRELENALEEISKPKSWFKKLFS
jgi:CBS domain-containing protein